MTKTQPLKILITAIEPSADLIGARLMEEIEAHYTAPVLFTGCGGIEMRKKGLYSPFLINRLSVMGATDIARVYKKARCYTRLIGTLAKRIKPDIVICIDGWLFSKAVAREVKKNSPESVLVKYAAPQVWASRPGRVHDVKKYFDLVLSLFPFDLPFFEKIDMPASFVGNPNFEVAALAPKDAENFKNTYGLGGEKIIALLPGSRQNEITRLGPVFGEVAARLLSQTPDLVFMVPVAAGMEGTVRQVTEQWKVPCTIIQMKDRFSLFGAADAALTASGTASTELAICGTPVVVAYKTSFLSYHIARAILTVDFVSIMNIVAQEEIIPEFLQHKCTADNIFEAVNLLIGEESARERQLDAFERLVVALGAGPAEHDIMRSASLSACRVIEFYQKV